MVWLTRYALAVVMALCAVLQVVPQPKAAPQGFEVRLHPAGALQVGDVISIEVYAQPIEGVRNMQLEVHRLNAGMAQPIGSTVFEPAARGLQRAALTWAWDTRGLSAGDYTLLFSVTPGQVEWQQSITLQPFSAADAKRHQWVRAETPCCVVHVISGTNAERDLPSLLEMIERQAQIASTKMGYQLTHKVQINLIPRVLGQGGFAGEELYISYTGGNYTLTDLEMVIQHEMIHRIDADLRRGFRPTLLVEGLAVYLTGGHYKTEPVVLRAAAMEAAGMLMPLENLAENFYDHQHEISYLHAAAVVDFLTRTWGWQRFLAFYDGIQAHPTGSQAAALDAALQAEFGITLAQLDDRLTGFLQTQPVLPDLREDARLTIAFYESIRHYQQILDPSAHFQQVWLPDASQMRERGIVGDFLRGPDTPTHRASETLLTEAGKHWRAGRFERAWSTLAELSAQRVP